MDFLVIDDDKTFRDATCFLIEEAGITRKALSPVHRIGLAQRRQMGRRFAGRKSWQGKWTGRAA